MICDDFDRALEIVSEHLPLKIVAIPSGTECGHGLSRKNGLCIPQQLKMNGEVVLDANEHALALFIRPVRRNSQNKSFSNI